MAKASKDTEPTPAAATAVADAPVGEQTSAQGVQFPDLVERPATSPAGQLDLLLDMDVSVAVMLGQTQVPIRRLLQLGPGAIVSLGKPIEAPVELYLQGAKFAEGDVVVVDNRFAIRIRQLTPVEGAGGQK